MKKYKVVVADSYQVVASGFRSLRAACEWASNHDYGQFENDGGLLVLSYWE